MSALGSHKHGVENKEAGMVSILVTMILMIVISLIVIGFAQIAQRNSREALDQQLSTSAFYAAESGINDVRNLIATYGTPPAKTDCTNGSGAEATYYANLPSSTINSAAGVSYSCVMVNPAATTLPYTLSNTGTIVPLTSASGSIKTLTFTWQPTSTSNVLTGCSGNLTTSTAWTCGYAGIRFDLVRTDGVTFTTSNATAMTMSSFLLPVASGGTNTVGFASNGSADLTKVTCTTTNCTLTISSGLGGGQYYLRILSQYYQSVNLQITGTDNSGNAVSFTGAQILIDVTGKAQDVLRRVQVRVPSTGTSTNETSDYAMESTDSICKRFDIMTNHYQSDAGNAVTTMDNSGNPLCESP